MTTVGQVKAAARPLHVALVDDYDVVVIGLAHLFDPYRDRIVIAELDTNQPVVDEVDVVLYDSFAQPEADHDDLGVLVDNPHARHVVVYTWNFHPALIESALAKGASGYLSKTLPARDLVTAIEAIADGEVILSDVPRRSRSPAGLDWPGRGEGLTDREAEVLALITQGKTNVEIAAVMYLSVNTIKSYIRSAYRKIGVTTRPTPSCGASSTAFSRTSTASTTGAADLELRGFVPGRAESRPVTSMRARSTAGIFV